MQIYGNIPKSVKKVFLLRFETILACQSTIYKFNISWLRPCCRYSQTFRT